MSGIEKLPDNVIPVNFRARNLPNSNPFAIFVDEHCKDVESFSRALLSSSEKTYQKKQNPFEISNCPGGFSL